MTQPRKSNAPRRIKVKSERGIYYRDVRRDGKPARVYEITYTDRFHKQRWETVKSGGIEAARALRGQRLTTGGPDPAPSRESFRSVGAAYLVAKRTLRPKTRETYVWALEQHIYEWKPTRTAPAFADRPVASITPDLLAALIAHLREEGLSEWTLKAIATPLRGVLALAFRRGHIVANPWAQLTPEEKPGSGISVHRILDRDEIIDVLAHAGSYRCLLLTAIFTGVRIGELLALRWCDVDSKAGVLRVTEQITSRGKRAKLKTKRARRAIILPRFLVQALVEHRLASSHSTEKAPVFAGATGRPVLRKSARSALRRAIREANKHRDAKIGRVRFHDLRHTYASILIAKGEDIIFVSRKLGHSKPSTTLDIYGDLFDEARHAERARDRLDDDFGTALG